MNHIYDLDQTFEENATYGPFWDKQIPKIPVPKKKWSFLGYKLNSPFGIAACPLTATSRHLKLMSHLGYDLLTFKSVRSVEWRGNPAPHWRYINAPKSVLPRNKPLNYLATLKSIKNQAPSMANSFGIHSIKPEYWQEDVDVSIDALSSGQLLILSLMPTPIKGQSLVDDSKRLAKLAKQTKASIFEVNLACPNTDGGEGLIYEDLNLSIAICKAMKKILKNTPLLVKVGYYHDPEKTSQFLNQTKGIIDGIASINTYQGEVYDRGKKESFPGRPTAGISGATIKPMAMDQARIIVSLKNKLKLKNFVTIGIGGVTKPSDIDQYLKIGVDAVQSAVGAYHDPLLAVKYKRKLIK